MQTASQNRSSLVPVLATVTFALLAGCTTSGTENAAATSGEQRVKASELRAYCPSVTLREGTAYFNSYEKGKENDPAHVIYQASITDTTRSCQYADGSIIIDVAAAGKVIPGPKYRSGTITMPIRIAVVEGDKVIHSKLHHQSVSVTSGGTATQFVFNEKGISFPMPAKQNVQIFVGFDEGPYNTN